MFLLDYLFYKQKPIVVFVLLVLLVLQSETSFCFLFQVFKLGTARGSENHKEKHLTYKNYYFLCFEPLVS